MKKTPSDRKNGSDAKDIPTKVIKGSKKGASQLAKPFMWWLQSDAKLRAQELLSTASWLKTTQQDRYRKASIHARMYGNIPLGNNFGNTAAMGAQNNQLPIDRPTFNVVQSAIDTLTSRITQSRPLPTFLTDGGNYKKRNLAKQLNRFIQGEFYQTKAYEMGEMRFREACVLGDGLLHVYETPEKRVGLERVLETELFVDNNDAFYGKPRTMYRLKLVDREVLRAAFPSDTATINSAEQAYPDTSGDSAKTVTDQVMVVEAWHLASGPDANDGLHIIATTEGELVNEPWTKDRFPFSGLQYSPRLVGFWAQGLTEQLTGTQIEINKLLITISQSIALFGVPRVFVEAGSKIIKAHLNNQVGGIVTYTGTKPEYEVAPCVPAELYQQLQRLIDYAFQQSGVSSLAASAQKPAGLNSGEAIRNYDDLQTDRFATIQKRYANGYEDLAYLMIDVAKDIAKQYGSYSTIYPGKNGTESIDLPKVDLLEDPFVIQCFDSSALPKDPSGRLQKITEMTQAGMISQQEGRRLLNYPDLEQNDKLEIAAEERILKQLDDIVDSGKYVPPDPFTDLQQGKKLVVQYYNLYAAAKLESSKLDMLGEWSAALDLLVQGAMPPAPPAGQMQPGGSNGAGATQGTAAAQPVSDLMPNVQ